MIRFQLKLTRQGWEAARHRRVPHILRHIRSCKRLVVLFRFWWRLRINWNFLSCGRYTTTIDIKCFFSLAIVQLIWTATIFWLHIFLCTHFLLMSCPMVRYRSYTTFRWMYINSSSVVLVFYSGWSLRSQIYFWHMSLPQSGESVRGGLSHARLSGFSLFFTRPILRDGHCLRVPLTGSSSQFTGPTLQGGHCSHAILRGSSLFHTCPTIWRDRCSIMSNLPGQFFFSSFTLVGLHCVLPRVSPYRLCIITYETFFIADLYDSGDEQRRTSRARRGGVFAFSLAVLAFLPLPIVDDEATRPVEQRFNGTHVRGIHTKASHILSCRLR